MTTEPLNDYKITFEIKRFIDCEILISGFNEDDAKERLQDMILNDELDYDEIKEIDFSSEIDTSDDNFNIEEIKKNE